MPQRPVPRDALDEISQSFQRFRVAVTAVDLRLFDRIEGRSVRVGDVSSLLGIEERPARIFLNVLAAMGLLEHRAGRYRNAPVAGEYLVEGRPRYYGDFLRMLDRRLYDRYKRFEWSLRNNRPASADPAIGDLFQTMSQDPKDFRTFLLGMHSTGAEVAARLARRVDLSRQRHLLDVGGGSGVYAITLARRHRKLRATVFDLPAALAVAREMIEGAGLGDRIDTVAGDFFRDRWPSGADTILFSQILHDWSPEKCRALLRRASDALPKGGLVIVRELFRDDDGPGPLSAAMVSATMLLETEGENYAWATYEGWLREAGFGRFRRVRLMAPRHPNGALLAKRL